MTGIEKVARALWELDQARPFKDFSNKVLYGHTGPVSWEEATSPGVVQFGPDQFRENARAAILAIREPDETQYAAICATGKMWRDLNSCAVWQLYIDALLNEKPE